MSIAELRKLPRLEKLKIIEALWSDLVDRTHHDALAVGVDQMRVLPRPRDRRQAGRIQLARGEHDLLGTAAQRVPVDVDI